MAARGALSELLAAVRASSDLGGLARAQIADASAAERPALRSLHAAVDSARFLNPAEPCTVIVRCADDDDDDQPLEVAFPAVRPLAPRANAQASPQRAEQAACVEPANEQLPACVGTPARGRMHGQPRTPLTSYYLGPVGSPSSLAQRTLGKRTQSLSSELGAGSEGACASGPSAKKIRGRALALDDLEG